MAAGDAAVREQGGDRRRKAWKFAAAIGILALLAGWIASRGPGYSASAAVEGRALGVAPVGGTRHYAVSVDDVVLDTVPVEHQPGESEQAAAAADAAALDADPNLLATVVAVGSGFAVRIEPELGNAITAISVDCPLLVPNLLSADADETVRVELVGEIVSGEARLRVIHEARGSADRRIADFASKLALYQALATDLQAQGINAIASVDGVSITDVIPFACGGGQDSSANRVRVGKSH